MAALHDKAALAVAMASAAQRSANEMAMPLPRRVQCRREAVSLFNEALDNFSLIHRAFHEGVNVACAAVDGARREYGR